MNLPLLQLGRVSFLVLTAFVTSAFSQVTPPTDVLAFFDEHKRWYNGFTEAWFSFHGISETDVRSSIELWERIGAELRIEPDDLPRTYVSGGSTHGDYFRWAPKNGFVWLSVNKCMGGPMRIVRGRVEVFRDGITLLPGQTFGSSEGHGSHHAHANATTLINAGWNGDSYLVQKQHLSDFIDYTAGLGEFNNSFGFIEGIPFLVKIGTPDESGDQPSIILPDAYKHLIKAPVRGRIVGIARTRRITSHDESATDDLVTDLRVQLDGKARPVKGMTFLAVGTNQHRFEERLTLKSVRGLQATVEYSRPTRKVGCIVTSEDDCKDLEPITPRIGMVLSTNGY